MTAQTPLAPESTASAPPPRRRGAATAVSVATIVLGATVLAATLGTTALSAAASVATGSESLTTAVDGVSDLDVDLAAGDLTIVFADVDEARLQADRSSFGASWRLDRRGESLHVSSPDGPFAGWARSSSATLTLPRTLESVDADIEVGGGVVDLDGRFGSLDVDVSGGRVTLAGSASDVDLTVTGGSADTRLAGVTTAAFELTGGNLAVELTGATPVRTTLEATAGSADIVLPDDVYAVSIERGFGQVDNRLRSDADATATVRVSVVAGSVTLSS